MKRLVQVASAAAISILLLSQIAVPLLAAVSQNLPVSVQTPNLNKCQFVQGTDVALTYKTCYTGGTNGTKIKGIWLTSTDTGATHLINVQISSSTTQHCATLCYAGVAITLPINAGNANGVPAINVLSATNWPGLPLDSDGNPYLYLPANTWTIEATFTTALTASTNANVIVLGEDF